MNQDRMDKSKGNYDNYSKCLFTDNTNDCSENNNINSQQGRFAEILSELRASVPV